MTARVRTPTAGALILLLALVLGTAAPTLADATPEPATAAPAAGTTQVSIYFLREGKIGAAHRKGEGSTGEDAAADAVRALLKGPAKSERKAGLTTAIPRGTELREVAIDAAAKTATVDLSASFDEGDDPGAKAARQAEVVFTLTQFPDVERVAIAVEGTAIDLLGGDGTPLPGPAARTDYERLTPLIFLESPAPGDTIASPVRLWGTANTFEATFMATVLDADGTVLVSQVVTATSGNGVRGTFDLELPFEVAKAGRGTVVVYETSPKDGKRENEVSVPVKLRVEPVSSASTS
jgi:spore germination protein GerM